MTKLPEIVSQRSSVTLNNKDSKKFKDEDNFKFGTAPHTHNSIRRESSVKVRDMKNGMYDYRKKNSASQNNKQSPMHEK